MGESKITRRDLALRDLEELSEFIRQDSPRSALRFLEAAERTFALLAAMPLMGEAYGSEEPRLAGMRRFHISGFERYLIYYRPIDGGIEVVRVLHGARDLPSALGEIELE